MGDNGTNGSAPGGESMIGKLVFWAIAIIAGLIILRLVFAAVGIAVFLAFRLLPVLVVAYLLYQAWKWIASKPAGD